MSTMRPKRSRTSSTPGKSGSPKEVLTESSGFNARTDGAIELTAVEKSEIFATLNQLKESMNFNNAIIVMLQSIRDAIRDMDRHVCRTIDIMHKDIVRRSASASKKRRKVVKEPVMVPVEDSFVKGYFTHQAENTLLEEEPLMEPAEDSLIEKEPQSPDGSLLEQPDVHPAEDPLLEEMPQSPEDFLLEEEPDVQPAKGPLLLEDGSHIQLKEDFLLKEDESRNIQLAEDSPTQVEPITEHSTDSCLAEDNQFCTRRLDHGIVLDNQEPLSTAQQACSLGGRQQHIDQILQVSEDQIRLRKLPLKSGVISQCPLPAIIVGKLKNSTTDVYTFAKLALYQLFTIEEMTNCNCSGFSVKYEVKPLNQQKLNYIRSLLDKYYSPATGSSKSQWIKVVKRLDRLIRYHTEGTRKVKVTPYRSPVTRRTTKSILQTSPHMNSSFELPPDTGTPVYSSPKSSQEMSTQAYSAPELSQEMSTEETLIKPGDEELQNNDLESNYETSSPSPLILETSDEACSSSELTPDINEQPSPQEFTEEGNEATTSVFHKLVFPVKQLRADEVDDIPLANELIAPIKKMSSNRQELAKQLFQQIFSIETVKGRSCSGVKKNSSDSACEQRLDPKRLEYIKDVIFHFYPITGSENVVNEWKNICGKFDRISRYYTAAQNFVSNA